jgi:plastocyanin
MLPSRIAGRLVGTSVVLGLFTTGPVMATPTPQQAAAAASQATEVRIDNFSFTPSVIEVPAGARVTWTNHDDIPHTVVASNKEFRSRALDTDDSYAFVFTKPGTFEYFCGLHPHMKGTIVVTP